MLIEIKNDVFDVVKRIKKIDKHYQLFYNTKKRKYELHNKSQKFNTYCMSFPYDYVDERMVNLTLKTRTQNRDKIFKEIEEENAKIMKLEMKKCKDKILKGEL